MIDDHPSIDLLVIGALAIDRIASATVPGGSVLYATEAAAAAGFRVAAATTCGAEATARAGLDRLAAAALTVKRHASPVTTRFSHEHHDDRRVLTLEARADPIDPAGDAIGELVARDRPPAILAAPIEAEISGALAARLRSLAPATYAAASIQGWLRCASDTGRVEAVTLGAVDVTVRRALAGFDLVVASEEDLMADGVDAAARLNRLRAWTGPRPDLVVTMGAAGALLDCRGERHVVRPPRVVRDVATVGAGDAFAAVLAAARGTGQPVLVAATSAAAMVTEILSARQAT